MLQTLRISWVVMMLSACAAGEVMSGPTEELAGDALAIAARVEPEPLPFGSELLVELTRAAGVRVFEFELTAQARLELVATLLTVETPLDISFELQRITQRGRKLSARARSESTAEDPVLLLRQVLHEGRYRLSVKGTVAPGYPRDASATITLLGVCTGAGCPAPVVPDDPSACLFGDVFNAIRSNPALSLSNETWWRDVADLDGLTALTGEQLLRAVQQSSHTDVTTPAEALARVDQQEVQRIELTEVASGREFIVFEYGAGDNSYGAFFASDSSEVVASIHDGDLLACQITAADGGSSD
ncbi:MAG: hypothetical protein RL701_2041 [Pseudomonadota bacterium]